MTHPLSKLISSGLCAALTTAGLALIATPASTQSVEELTVTGVYGPGREPQRLSMGVSYADLDLRTQFGQDELKRRIDVTARYLCNKLGENNSSPSVVPSCREAAVNEGRKQARIAIDAAPVRMAGWKPGPAWIPPGE